MGVEHKGDIKYFGSIVKPNIGVITLTNSAHISNFKDKDEYKKEKLNLKDILKENGKLIINIDDDFLAKNKPNGAVTFGIDNEDADILGRDIKVSLFSTEYRIEKIGQKIAINSKCLGRQSVYTGLVAFSIGQLFEIQFLKIKKSLEAILPIPGRMNTLLGERDMVIIDDTYNANPVSVKEALNVLKAIRYSRGRKVAIIGNMNELGSYEEADHRDVASFARDKCDLIIFAGKNALIMRESFADNQRSIAFSDRKELLKNIKGIVEPKDLILIKASQNGNYFEEVVKVLIKDKDKAKDLLVRQSKFWLRKK